MLKNFSPCFGLSPEIKMTDDFAELLKANFSSGSVVLIQAFKIYKWSQSATQERLADGPKVLGNLSQPRNFGDILDSLFLWCLQSFSALFWLNAISICSGWEGLPGGLDFPSGSDSKESACNAGDPGLIPGLERSPVEENGNSLQYSCLENPTDRGAWWATVHGVRKSWLGLSY